MLQKQELQRNDLETHESTKRSEIINDQSFSLADIISIEEEDYRRELTTQEETEQSNLTQEYNLMLQNIERNDLENHESTKRSEIINDQSFSLAKIILLEEEDYRRELTTQEETEQSNLTQEYNLMLQNIERNDLENHESTKRSDFENQENADRSTLTQKLQKLQKLEEQRIQERIKILNNQLVNEEKKDRKSLNNEYLKDIEKIIALKKNDLNYLENLKNKTNDLSSEEAKQRENLIFLEKLHWEKKLIENYKEVLLLDKKHWKIKQAALLESSYARAALALILKENCIIKLEPSKNWYKAKIIFNFKNLNQTDNQRLQDLIFLDLIRIGSDDEVLLKFKEICNQQAEPFYSDSFNKKISHATILNNIDQESLVSLTLAASEKEIIYPTLPIEALNQAELEDYYNALIVKHIIFILQDIHVTTNNELEISGIKDTLPNDPQYRKIFTIQTMYLNFLLQNNAKNIPINLYKQNPIFLRTLNSLLGNKILNLKAWLEIQRNANYEKIYYTVNEFFFYKIFSSKQNIKEIFLKYFRINNISTTFTPCFDLIVKDKDFFSSWIALKESRDMVSNVLDAKQLKDRLKFKDICSATSDNSSILTEMFFESLYKFFQIINKIKPTDINDIKFENNPDLTKEIIAFFSHTVNRWTLQKMLENTSLISSTQEEKTVLNEKSPQDDFEQKVQYLFKFLGYLHSQNKIKPITILNEVPMPNLENDDFLEKAMSLA